MVRRVDWDIAWHEKKDVYKLASHISHPGGVEQRWQFVSSEGTVIDPNSDPGKVTDLAAGNLPPKKGVRLEGTGRQHTIQMFRDLPPIAGLDPTNSTYQVAVQDNCNPDKGGYATSLRRLHLMGPPGGLQRQRGEEWRVI